MGKFSTLAPAYVGLRCGNSDYGASDMNSIASLSFLSPRFTHNSAHYLTKNSPVIYSARSDNTFRGQNYVN